MVIWQPKSRLHTPIGRKSRLSLQLPIGLHGSAESDREIDRDREMEIEIEIENPQLGFGNCRFPATADLARAVWHCLSERVNGARLRDTEETDGEKRLRRRIRIRIGARN